MRKSIFILFLIISNCKAQNSSFIVHEWGTFTARYNYSSIPYDDLNIRVEEPVPSFVYSLNFKDVTRKQIWNTKNDDYTYLNLPVLLKDVTIKMETPVLYFYSPYELKNVNVSVNFNQGTISEYYPMPSQKESLAYCDSKINQPFNTDLPTLSFKNYKGWASWSIDVLPPNTERTLTHPNESVSKVWLAPRKTESNSILCNNEVEKYIFYRGLASFENPIIPRHLSNGKIEVENKAGDLPFIMVYERTGLGERFVWGMQEAKADEKIIFSKVNPKISTDDWNKSYKQVFINELIKDGLYESEAKAMIATWENSYFEKTGISVFWIVPKAFTDAILPLTISHNPTEITRVFVGRTQIDNANYIDNKGLENPRTLSNFKCFPNPTSDKLYLQSNINNYHSLNFVITNQNGIKVKEQVFSFYGTLISNIDISDLAPGIYLLSVPDSNYLKKIIKI